MPRILTLNNKVTFARVNANVCHKYIVLCKFYIVNRYPLADAVPHLHYADMTLPLVKS
jgi:hypothetical protein